MTRAKLLLSSQLARQLEDAARAANKEPAELLEEALKNYLDDRSPYKRAGDGATRVGVDEGSRRTGTEYHLRLVPLGAASDKRNEKRWKRPHITKAIASVLDDREAKMGIPDNTGPVPKRNVRRLHLTDSPILGMAHRCIPRGADGGKASGEQTSFVDPRRLHGVHARNHLDVHRSLELNGRAHIRGFTEKPDQRETG
jgi:hypothetical protein